MLLLSSLMGCEVIDNIDETVGGLTNPLVAEAIVLGVEEPSSQDLDISLAGFEAGASARVWLADAANLDNIDQAPVGGATVSLRSDTNGNVAMLEGSAGEYQVSTAEDPALGYAAGETVTIVTNTGDETHKVSTTAPQAVDVDVPSTLSAGSGLTLDASGQNIDNLMVIVFRADTGEITFSNEPQDIAELYELAHESGDVVVDVPASALSTETVYGVGVAGMRNGSASDFEDVNTALSAIMAGKLRFYPVSTL